MIKDVSQLTDYSLGFFKYNGMTDALFYVNPLGALKGALFFLNEALLVVKLTDIVSICSSDAQRLALKQHESNSVISYPPIARYIDIRPKPLLLFFFCICMALIFASRKNNSLRSNRFFQRVTFYTQVLAGCIVSKNLLSKTAISALYVSTDHCPIVLSTIYHIKRKNKNVKIFYTPHGGHMGMLNKYRTLSWSKFDKILPKSSLQRDVFKYWAEHNRLVLNVEITKNEEILLSKQKVARQPAFDRGNYVFWINQADLWDKYQDDLANIVNYVNEAHLIKDAKFQVVTKSIEQTKLFSKITKINPNECFLRAEHYFDNKRANGDIPNIHICLSSSVISDVLLLGEPILFTQRCPLHHDEAFQNILRAAGLTINCITDTVWLAEGGCLFNPEYFGRNSKKLAMNVVCP